jgi:hypothetical protein
LTALSIETVFVDWMIDSNAWLMEMVSTYPNISQVDFWTEFNKGKHVRIEH